MGVCLYTAQIERGFADIENSASVQAMLADICMEKCGHFASKLELQQNCHIVDKL